MNNLANVFQRKFLITIDTSVLRVKVTAICFKSDTSHIRAQQETVRQLPIYFNSMLGLI